MNNDSGKRHIEDKQTACTERTKNKTHMDGNLLISLNCRLGGFCIDIKCLPWAPTVIFAPYYLPMMEECLSAYSTKYTKVYIIFVKCNR